MDAVTSTIFLLSSLDNYHQRLQQSADDGATWTPSAQARDLDASLRLPGWGLVFTGLPGGIQLKAPNPHAGRLVICSSAYWGTSSLSRYSYTIMSDDHGASWRIGSGKIQPRHTTECSVAQALTGRKGYAGSVQFSSGKSLRRGGWLWVVGCGLCGGIPMIDHDSKNYPFWYRILHAPLFFPSYSQSFPS